MDDTFERLENWMREMELHENIPNAYQIWEKSNKAFRNGDMKLAKLYQNMKV